MSKVENFVRNCFNENSSESVSEINKVLNEMKKEKKIFQVYTIQYSKIRGKNENCLLINALVKDCENEKIAKEIIGKLEHLYDNLVVALYQLCDEHINEMVYEIYESSKNDMPESRILNESYWNKLFCNDEWNNVEVCILETFTILHKYKENINLNQKFECFKEQEEYECSKNVIVIRFEEDCECEEECYCEFDYECED